jgi:hypothetical protein
MKGSAFVVAVALVVALPATARASSHAVNFQTKTEDVVCGIVAAVPGTELDPGTGAPLNGYYPGLQCSAASIPKPKHGIGDPFVQLGQGRTGRARLVDESQDDLISDANFVTLAPGSTWKRYGITCELTASSVRCTNGTGHGFEISTGHLSLFSTASEATTSCGSVSYTYPGTHGEGRAALNNLTASGVSCSTARTVAGTFLASNKPPKGWHVISKTVTSRGNTLGEVIFTRGSARVIGDLAN